MDLETPRDAEGLLGQWLTHHNTDSTATPVPPQAAEEFDQTAVVPPPRRELPDPVETEFDRIANTAGRAAIAATTTAHEPEIPWSLDFHCRELGQRILDLIVGLGISLAIGAWVWAYAERDPIVAAIALTASALAAILCAVRLSSIVTRISLHGGELVVARGGTRHVFDLASPQTGMRIVGTPGRRGWKVVLEGRDMAPVVIDRHVVDPQAFMEVVAFHRGAA